MLSRLVIFGRRLCALVVALALFAAPCLSMLSISTGQTSHVHHLAAVYETVAENQRHSHSGHHAGAGHARHADSGVPKPPVEQIASCCLLCEGCVSVQPRLQADPGQLFPSVSWMQDDTGGSGGHPAIVDQNVRAPPKERSSAGTIIASSRRVPVPLYLLTQRFLI